MKSIILPEPPCTVDIAWLVCGWSADAGVEDADAVWGKTPDPYANA